MFLPEFRGRVKLTTTPSAGKLADMATTAYIDGQNFPELHRLALRWTADKTPMLYLDGRRITKPWLIHSEEEQPEDKIGVSTNTAG